MTASLVSVFLSSVRRSAVHRILEKLTMGGSHVNSSASPFVETNQGILSEASLSLSQEVPKHQSLWYAALEAACSPSFAEYASAKEKASGPEEAAPVTAAQALVPEATAVERQPEQVEEAAVVVNGPVQEVTASAAVVPAERAIAVKSPAISRQDILATFLPPTPTPIAGGGKAKVKAPKTSKKKHCNKACAGKKVMRV